jgi:hypothetical protein
MDLKPMPSSNLRFGNPRFCAAWGKNRNSIGMRPGLGGQITVVIAPSMQGRLS